MEVIFLFRILLLIFCILIPFPQDGDHDDDDQDEDGPREANPEGRVEKYIGVKVKASVFLLCRFAFDVMFVPECLRFCFVL